MFSLSYDSDFSRELIAFKTNPQNSQVSEQSSGKEGFRHRKP
jgi:hypothetical protein